MTRKYKEIEEGDVFGLLTVVDTNVSEGSGKRFHKCLCDCGNIVKVRDDSLKSSGSKSCGCSSKKALEEYRLEKLFKVGEKIKRKIAEEVIEHFCLEKHPADALRKRYD